jgi:hypothetical protein
MVPDAVRGGTGGTPLDNPTARGPTDGTSLPGGGRIVGASGFTAP